MINVLFDMETADPDDFFTLCLLIHHPVVNLRAVTVTPGSLHQIGLVKHVLKKLNALSDGKNIPVGSRKKDHPKKCVSHWHYKFLGDIGPEEPDGEGYEVIHQTIVSYPDLSILTGAALTNLKYLFQHYPDTKISRWVGQGGFAGDNVVPEEYRLEKFKGKITCPTFNFNGDPDAAKLLLASNNIRERILVSKNVCHGMAYDKEFHSKLGHVQRSEALDMVYRGMDNYLKKKPQKLFHDPLAACVMINPYICNFKEVEVYREKGQWGSKIKENSNTQISISVDKDLFFKTLVGGIKKFSRSQGKA